MPKVSSAPVKPFALRPVSEAWRDVLELAIQLNPLKHTIRTGGDTDPCPATSTIVNAVSKLESRIDGLMRLSLTPSKRYRLTLLTTAIVQPGPPLVSRALPDWSCATATA